ncbi:DegV family protein [Lederbergia galactosidilytica]|uniref:EDD domain protein, DegV family n=1 Tax=Lederbergia galactosidilytica TaxID=217031 RepID=A0A177ZXF7_9BACI|nr:DegV family protein [Lederbergia galactosidilytica]KRG11071.1 EDD domain protein, DegV family [Virgibacillus soli]MBP1916565.1 DegV family protein with EDD domain [Lederbergia galactosidilytica]OAK71980.1 EDD domain protein, DegV family [Lederbergia galactosidilytica]
MKKIILSADSTCDLDDCLKQRYKVHCQPLHINLGNKQYEDGVNITPDDIYDTYEKQRILPKTSAPNPKEYIDYFKQWIDQGYEVVHISLGSGLSSSYQNACIAAEELGNIYPVDSGNLSTGMGLLVIEAAERIAKGMPAAQISEEINQLKLKVQASFVIDKLTYLREGGRCSAIAAFSANLLNIKPCIEVDPTSGNMNVGKKYRGALSKTLKRYTLDKLNERSDLKLDRIFITHSGTSSENIDIVKKTIEEVADFKEILVTRAGCTISSHCGPNTVGVLFVTK